MLRVWVRIGHHRYIVKFCKPEILSSRVRFMILGLRFGIGLGSCLSL